MDLFFVQWMTLIAVFSLAIISPGPDFVMAVRNSVYYSRRAGIFTAIGFALGVLVHITYCVIGIGALIANSVLAFNVIKWAGAGYLIYIGIQSLRSKEMKTGSIIEDQSHPEMQSMSSFEALRSGFLTNLLNPKATLFFMAVFSQVINPETPVSWQITYGVTCAVMTVTWFSAVALVLTQQSIRHMFIKSTLWINRVCGALLIALGLKVALSS